MKHVFLIANFLFAVLWAVTPTWGSPPDQLIPVDQAVGDLDRLGTSLRRVDQGIHTDGQRVSLYRIPDQGIQGGAADGSGLGSQPYSQSYYRVSPGITARVDRLDYLVRVGRRGVATNIKPRLDGEFLELVTANTVFELAPPQTVPGATVSQSILNPATPSPPPNGSLSLTPIDYRMGPTDLHGRIDTRIDTQTNPNDRTISHTTIPADRGLELLMRRSGSTRSEADENNPEKK